MMARLLPPLILALLSTAAPAQTLLNDDNFRSLTSDNRARAVGDLLTVLVQESSSATTSANTNLGRSNGVSVKAYSPSRDQAAGLTSNNQFDGKGQTQRAGRLLAQLTVAVVEVARNGDLLVYGDQMLEINQESQRIRVEGRVRTTDISESNTVLSSRLADAKIAYVGEGEVSERQRPSWWNKFLSWFGI